MARSKKHTASKYVRRTRRQADLLTALFIIVVVLCILLALAYMFRDRLPDDVRVVVERIVSVLVKGDDSDEKRKPAVVGDGEISFHFIYFDNDYAGDSIYIKAGESDILIDAGARSSNQKVIEDYINQYVTDGKLEYVVATHADQDHIACFAGTTKTSLFDSYECGTIIDFPLSDKTSATYTRYCKNRDAEVEAGAVHYTALECYNEINGAKRVYELSAGVTMEILYNYYYENKSADENNYSVCLLFRHGERKFLFTGDLEKEGEAKLVDFYSETDTLKDVEFYKAGHHGSKTSSTMALLSVARPNMCVVSCCAGSVEYTQIAANTFPTQTFIDNISQFTDKVYVTAQATVVETDGKWKNTSYAPLNGNIVVLSSKQGVEVKCSVSDTLLKDTQWMLNNRTMPLPWKGESSGKDKLSVTFGCAYIVSRRKATLVVA